MASQTVHTKQHNQQGIWPLIAAMRIIKKWWLNNYEEKIV